MTATYRASCHCGRIQIEMAAELSEVVECNCSICSRSGFLHWYVAPEQVKLLTEKVRLSTYMWRAATGGHHFCPTCGVAVIRTSTQFPPPVQAATRLGGQLMGRSEDLGCIAPGHLADLLLVDGDPLADIRILQDAGRLTAIMKSGRFHKSPAVTKAKRRPAAAE